MGIRFTLYIRRSLYDLGSWTSVLETFSFMLAMHKWLLICWVLTKTKALYQHCYRTWIPDAIKFPIFIPAAGLSSLSSTSHCTTPASSTGNRSSHRPDAPCTFSAASRPFSPSSFPPLPPPLLSSSLLPTSSPEAVSHGTPRSAIQCFPTICRALFCEEVIISLSLSAAAFPSTVSTSDFC